MTDPAALARGLYWHVEAIHAGLYFVQEARDAYAALGLEPVGQGYVAGRAAPMGAVGPGPVVATFFNFNPALIGHALPAAWVTTTPAAVLDARASAMEEVYARIGGPSDGLVEATAIARAAAQGADFAGRPLAAANADVPTPGAAFADLWQALTVLREHRGDGHVALLVGEGLGPTEALVLFAGWQDRVRRRFLQLSRAWDDAAWAAGEDGLRERGWLDADGALTEAGRAARDRLEAATDRLAGAPYAALGDERCRRLFELLDPVASACAGGGVFPRPLALPDGPYW